MQDVKMSLLRQLPLVDSRLFPLANSKITCWCISYCCSGDVVIYSPAFFMSTFILISRVQTSSFSLNSISFQVMHLLTYKKGPFPHTGVKRHDIFLKKCSLHRKSYPMIFFSVLKTQYLFVTRTVTQIIIINLLEENNVSPHRATQHYFSFWGFKTE